MSQRIAESDVLDAVVMSLDGRKEFARPVEGPADGVDLIAQKLVHEDFAFSQMSGDQEKAVRGEDSPQFTEGRSELIPPQVLDRVEGDGAGEGSRREGERAHVPTHRAQTKTGSSHPDHRNGQVDTEDSGLSIRQVSTHLSWTATDVKDPPTGFDANHEGIERRPVNGQPIEVTREGLGVLMGHGAIGGANNVRTEGLHRESFPWVSAGDPEVATWESDERTVWRDCLSSWTYRWSGPASIR